jgi:hypothetical protein
MYDILGGSTLTNFFRGIITVSPIANSEVFNFMIAKRFEESGWPTKSQPFKWHEDRSRRVWVPASVVEADNAKNTAGKTLEDLQNLSRSSESSQKKCLKTKPTMPVLSAANIAGFWLKLWMIQPRTSSAYIGGLFIIRTANPILLTAGSNKRKMKHPQPSGRHAKQKKKLAVPKAKMLSARRYFSARQSVANTAADTNNPTERSQSVSARRALYKIKRAL